MYSLYLYDTLLHDKLYSKADLTSYLQKINFINNNSDGLYPADQFMFLVTFLGCSPNLNHDLKTDIQIQVKPNLNAYGGDSIEKIICPNCKKKIQEPSKLIKNYSKNTEWISDCCQKQILLEDINWRKSAGFSQTFIQISNIFPKEAIPSDDLLKLLSTFSNSNWKYFYSKLQRF